MPALMSKEIFIEKCKIKHKDNFSYEKTLYTGLNNRIIVTCFAHGDVCVSALLHLNGSKCLLCAGYRFSTDDFKEKAKNTHGDIYDYSLSSYTGTNHKLIIICKIHGEFLQEPEKHISRKQGCAKCNKPEKVSIDEFKRRANLIHKFKYDYSSTNYISRLFKVEIICSNHGSFFQLPGNHTHSKNPQGCMSCSRDNALSNKKEFIEKAIIIHDNKYDYSKVEYLNSTNKIEIICLKHGSFFQTPNAHLSGKSNCPKCVGFSSLKESLWLDYIGIPNTKECRQVTLYLNGKRYLVDGYNSDFKICYEFNGDYWHGNPDKYDPEEFNKHNKKQFKELYQSTLMKRKLLTEAGYKVISIWESEFNKSRKR